jgi:hypothetical protein
MYNAGAMKVFLNGQEILSHGSTYLGLSLRNSKSGFMLGSLKRPGNAWDRNFNGVFADVRIYDRILKAAEIRQEWTRVQKVAPTTGRPAKNP